MTNVIVYISLEKAGAAEGMERDGKERRRRKERGCGGVAKEMPCIPLSGRREPQTEGRGEKDREEREKYREVKEERTRGRQGLAGISPPHVKTDRAKEGGGGGL